MLQNNTLWTCFRGLRSRMPFPGYQIFTKKSGKFPIPSIQEHPLPGPDLVPVFRTGSSRLVSGRETFGKFLNASRINKFRLFSHSHHTSYKTPFTNSTYHQYKKKQLVVSSSTSTSVSIIFVLLFRDLEICNICRLLLFQSNYVYCTNYFIRS